MKRYKKKKKIYANISFNSFYLDISLSKKQRMQKQLVLQLAHQEQASKARKQICERIKITISLASYLNIIDHLKRVIRASGRKSYLFVMGKLNVAKMANFMEIDCYVLVSCPENSLIDSKVNKKKIFLHVNLLHFLFLLQQEFYRPIITPFELEIALIRYLNI